MSIDHDVPPGLVAELDALAPDEGLVAALEQTCPALLTGEDLAAYVRGSARVLNRATARLLEGLHHLGRAQEGSTERLGQIDEFSADELCGVMGWSRQMAARKLDLADDLAVRLPEVADMVWEGRPRGVQGPRVGGMDPRPRRGPRPPGVRRGAPGRARASPSAR